MNALTLYFHPLASYCMKALVGLYELDIPFTKHLVDLMNPAERAAFQKVWPLAKFPVLRDETRGVTVPESSIVLEYLDQHFGRRGQLVPLDPDLARECRLRDRFFDFYVSDAVTKIVTDKIRPAGKNDPHGVDEARARLETAYSVADEWLRQGPWAIGSAFSMADCAAGPALFYAEKVMPFGDRFRHLRAYSSRLQERPSFARALDEAKPYFAMFPG